MQLKKPGGARQPLVHSYIEEQIAKATCSGAPSLPSIRMMARQCGVSLVTMWRGVAVLRDQGRLTVVAATKGGVFVTGIGSDTVPAPLIHVRISNPPVTDPSRVTEPVWREVKRRLSTDILCGVYPPGSGVPPYKELRRRYGAHFQALRQALRSLAVDGRIESRGRTFAVSRPSAHSHPSALTLYSHAKSTVTMHDSTPRAAEFWRTLEQGCARLNVRLQVRSAHDMVNPPDRAARQAALRDRATSQAYVVLSLGIAGIMDPLLRILGSHDVPIALFTEVGAPVVPGSVGRNGLVASFGIATDFAAGRMAGNYLIGLGHTRIVCFAKDRYDPYMEARADGMDAALAGAGIPERVVRHYCLDCRGGDDARAVMVRTPHYRDLLALLDTARHRTAVSPNHAAMQDLLEREERLAIERFYFEAVRLQADKALADGTATAWVGLTDSLALALNAHLRTRGINPPVGLSIMGFDDTIGSFGADLTSFSYNTTAAVNAIFDHLFATRRGKPRTGPIVVEIPGRIVERRSTDLYLNGYNFIKKQKTIPQRV